MVFGYPTGGSPQTISLECQNSTSPPSRRRRRLATHQTRKTGLAVHGEFRVSNREEASCHGRVAKEKEGNDARQLFESERSHWHSDDVNGRVEKRMVFRRTDTSLADTKLTSRS